MGSDRPNAPHLEVSTDVADGAGAPSPTTTEATRSYLEFASSVPESVGASSPAPRAKGFARKASSAAELASSEGLEQSLKSLLGGSPLLLALFHGASPRELLRERPSGEALETRWNGLTASLDALARRGAAERQRAAAAQTELEARRTQLTTTAGQGPSAPLHALRDAALDELLRAQRLAFRGYLRSLAPSGTLTWEARQLAARHAEELGLDPLDLDRARAELGLTDEPPRSGTLPPAPLPGSPTTLEDTARALLNDPAVARDVLLQGHFARWLAAWSAPVPLRRASDAAANVAGADPVLAAHLAAWALGSTELRLGATLYASAADLGRDVLSDRVTAEVIESSPSSAALCEWLSRQGRPSAAEALQRVVAREGHAFERLRWAFGAPYTLGARRFTDAASMFSACAEDPAGEALLRSEFRSGRLLAWLESLSATARSESWLTLLRAARDRADGDETPLWLVAFEAGSIRGLRVPSSQGSADVIDDPRALTRTLEVARRWDGLKESLRSGTLLAWLEHRGCGDKVAAVGRPSVNPDRELNQLLWSLGMPGVIVEWGDVDRAVLAPRDLCTLYLEDPARFDLEARKGYLFEWLATAHADAIALPGSAPFSTYSAAARLVDRRWRAGNAPAGQVGLALAILCGLRALPRDAQRPGPRADQLGPDGGLLGVRPGRSTRDDWSAADAHFETGTLWLWVASQPRLSEATRTALDEVLGEASSPDALLAALRPVEPRNLKALWAALAAVTLLALAVALGTGLDRARSNAARGVPAARAPERCPAGRADCDHDPRSGCETYVRDDPDHCGACGSRCAASTPHTRATCESGRCALQCASGWIACDGVRDDADGCEANPNDSPEHCGGCDQACPTAPGRVAVCTAGSCGLSCGAGRMDCNGRERDGCETNIHDDVQHCGGCATRCKVMAPNTVTACRGGVCAVGACVAGYVDVDGESANGCEYRCVARSTRDEPDDAQVDSNCDGVDGEVSAAVFVAPDGDDQGPGTRAAPMRSVNAAIQRAGREGHRQVLLSAGLYSETVVLRGGVSIYGGYDRARGWRRSASSIAVIEGTTAEQGILAAVTGRALSTRTVLDQLTLRTVDAPAGTGVSTVGLWCIECPGLMVRRSNIVAGAASDGAAGANGAPGAHGGGGGRGGDGSGDSEGQGGAGGSGGRSVCADPGGNGGRGGESGVHDGAPGQASREAAGGGGGRGGDLGQAGTQGQSGRVGLRGRSGPSGLAASLVDNAWRGASGVDGADGTDGTSGGGGGGGGGQGCLVFCDDGQGNGGGGGGGAGCGGGGGRGGQAGGSSIAALFVRSARATISQCQLRAGRAGRGGDGGNGGSGGSGGSGGAGGRESTNEVGQGGNGGNGGNGGEGGHGGGGMGGSSIALLALDGALQVEGARLSAGTAGTGGRSRVGAGADGTSSATYQPAGNGARATPSLTDGLGRLAVDDFAGALSILRRLETARSPSAARLREFVQSRATLRIDTLVLAGQCGEVQSLVRLLGGARLPIDRSLFDRGCAGL
jgi:hypothetical protein